MRGGWLDERVCVICVLEVKLGRCCCVCQVSQLVAAALHNEAEL